MLVWLTDAGGFAIVIAYFIVGLSFIKLRKSEPDLERPYKVKSVLFGYAAVITSGAMGILYLPGMPSGLIFSEWILVGIWTVLGIAFYARAKAAYPDFGERASREPEEF